MENFMYFLADLIIYFWSAFINIDYWPISQPFYLSVVGLAFMFFTWLFFREKKAVM